LSGELSFLLTVSALQEIKQNGKELNLEEQVNHIVETVKKEYSKILR